MLEPIIGSTSREKVLLFIYARREGYAREIARFFTTDGAQIQKQLDRLEFGGILAGRPAGRTRPYTFNPRYPFMRELTALLAKAIEFYPRDQREALLMARRRPRRRAKLL